VPFLWVLSEAPGSSQSSWATLKMGHWEQSLSLYSDTLPVPVRIAFFVPSEEADAVAEVKAKGEGMPFTIWPVF
jgi:hypothetical protein